jgi:transposase
METSPSPFGVAPKYVAASKRGLKRGLFTKQRTVILMLDETIITETPPLYSCYCRIGEQRRVPITGNRARRILHGAINIESGDVVLLITHEWVQQTHQEFLQMVRAHWRGWNIVLFEDRGTPHTAEESLEVAIELGIEVRLLPRATPELNAMDHLWRHIKGRALSDRQTRSIEKSADQACQYILDMNPHERLQKAGVFSGNFWLAR